jgi:predicted small metal-binding protein
MTKHIACNDVVPGCAFEATAGNEDELLRQVTTHAAKAHGVEQITPELAEKVKAAIRSR